MVLRCVAGDGQCFYRALLLGYYEPLVWAHNDHAYHCLSRVLGEELLASPDVTDGEKSLEAYRCMVADPQWDKALISKCRAAIARAVMSCSKTVEAEAILAAVGSVDVHSAVRDLVLNTRADAEAWILGYAARAFGVNIAVCAPGCAAMDMAVHKCGEDDARVVTLLYTAPATEGGCGHYDVLYDRAETTAAAAADFLFPGKCSRCRSSKLLPQRLLSWPCGHWLCRECVLKDVYEWSCVPCRRSRVLWHKRILSGDEQYGARLASKRI
ncbi:hypothetical protein Pmar_PMAR018247 [Perkinsus marinus ATCC 50983]|uniref:RING-type domain-containing protein n=1 Tax=Perkinsus marinus (strain ATCC 50983 / TXsc) TaxID=423536 RepID=C5KPF8_PERM5|nr:hypothetical protein Pmar_PMAR018247 [Perkinsus marinus ATCC 50983]EER13636.1 hypothetical protein Pmar_PMAR018247 [Perkinsus marinus ATCC 50983]|eukprot:XP_002781841.1 hypothetical protein Pmar_PMAR018247 [Perkinsus marinus ATCC 50983]